ncbi:TonB-dependent receptor [uncultured Paludibaculum sp.]|uniref:TonB-dependent receptor n=1 Tax=uncultured Paludibaculum sp. TaxID=1765020 RepID=UPI002AAA742A|nr:TonB-dependent receptor [uncultured Paludibaculum sp.]
MVGIRIWVTVLVAILPLAVLRGQSGLPAPATEGQRGTASGPSMTVTITDESGRPVSQARVEIRAASGGTEYSRVTDAGGVVRVTPRLQGRYLVKVTAAGFAAESRFVDWRAEPAEVPVRLQVETLRQQVTVTSGSRVEELAEESPVKVEAVTREAMATTGYERLTDVLAEIPGVVTRSGSSSSVGTEQIRGINARQVAVLQDGLPMIGARGIKSGNLNLNRMSTGRLDRVEVVKGASSALFGSDAIGGVINMISREPTQKVQGNLSFSGGSLGIFDGRGDIGTRYRNLTAFLDLEQHRQDAYSLTPNSTSTVGPDLRRNDLLFRTRYAFTPRVALGFTANAYQNRETGRSVGETGPVSGLYNDSVQNYAVVGDFVPTTKTTLQLRAYSARYDENSRQDSIGASAPPSYANLNERYKRLDGTVSQQLGPWNFLQGGYEWVQDNYRGANRLVGDNDGRQVTSNDVWLQDRIRLSRIASLDVGGRVTSHSLFGTWAVPKVGLVVKLSDHWTARGAFGKGFRAPDLGQLYYRFANPASFYQVIGNPTLEPETSRSFSTGVDYRARRFRGGVHLFRNDVRNLIDTVNIGTPQTPAQMAALLARYGIPASFNPLLGRMTFLYQNFGRVYTQGFELDAEQAIKPGLRVAGAYTYLDARDTGTGLALPQRHKHQGYVRTEYSNPRWGLLANVRGSFFSKWWLSPAAGTRTYGYGLWDFYVSKKLPAGLQAFFTIDNFANSRDQKLGLPTPTFDRPDYGRMYRVGLRWSYGRAE